MSSWKQIGDGLHKYAEQTASDIGEDYSAALREMLSERKDVAASVGCTVTQVVAWVNWKVAG